MSSFPKRWFFSVASIVLLVITGFCVSPQPVAAKPDKDFQQYTDFFEKVYKTFEDNYYLAPDRKVYDHFLEKFKTAGHIHELHQSIQYFSESIVSIVHYIRGLKY